MRNLAWESLFIAFQWCINNQSIHIIYSISTLTAICSIGSRVTNTTKTFIGVSSLTGAIVQTWAATTGILLEEDNYT